MITCIDDSVMPGEFDVLGNESERPRRRQKSIERCRASCSRKTTWKCGDFWSKRCGRRAMT